MGSTSKKGTFNISEIRGHVTWYLNAERYCDIKNPLLNLYDFFIHFPLELGGEGCYLSFFLQKCNFSFNKMTSWTSGKEHFKASLYFCYLGTASLQTHQDNLSSWISLPLHTIPFLLWQWKESLSIAHDVTDSYHFAILVFMMAEVWRSNTPLFFKKIWSNFTAGWR